MSRLYERRQGNRVTTPRNSCNSCQAATLLVYLLKADATVQLSRQTRAQQPEEYSPCLVQGTTCIGNTSGKLSSKQHTVLGHARLGAIAANDPLLVHPLGSSSSFSSAS